MHAVGSLVNPSREPLGDSRADSPGHGPFVLEPRRHGVSSTLAQRLAGWRPAAVFGAASLVGYAVLATVIVGLGLLLTKVLVPIDAVGNVEQSVPSWIAENRRPWLTDASAVASTIGDVPVLPGLVALTIIVALVCRRFRIGAFLLTAILVELTLYRVAALVVPRDRPEVARLDVLPVDESFPSGHVAASFVVYIGLAWLIASRFPRRWVAILCWALGPALVLAVGLSRVYRGMHHPLDALAGALLGAGSLLVALVAIRAYAQARWIRAGDPDPRFEERAVT